jgi:hypothetical protein
MIRITRGIVYPLYPFNMIKVGMPSLEGGLLTHTVKMIQGKSGNVRNGSEGLMLPILIT